MQNRVVPSGSFGCYLLLVKIEKVEMRRARIVRANKYREMRLTYGCPVYTTSNAIERQLVGACASHVSFRGRNRRLYSFVAPKKELFASKLVSAMPSALYCLGVMKD
jgi:hypothetical protein